MSTDYKKNLDSFSTLSTLNVGGKTYHYRSLKKFAAKAGVNLHRLPFSLRILLENLLRCEDGFAVKSKDILNLANWKATAEPDTEIQFMPARVLMQDFTGVPAVADLAAMRAALKRLGGDPNRINPLQPAELVVDHSVQVDHFGESSAFAKNQALEYDRNRERYEFLRWGQSAFKDFRVVPPDTGIVHQVNVEYLATVAMTRDSGGDTWVYPDTLVGTDSHTTMVNGLGVLGWGVGGIEAEAALLGQPCSMLIPHVVGFKLTGKLPAGTTATDLVLTVTQMLRKKGVVGKFVEFYGPGLASLTLSDRATIANMAPEYGATIGIFPVDEKTTEYMALTGRADRVPLIQAYYQEQELWYTPSYDPQYTDTLELDLAKVESSLAGPARPQDRVNLSDSRTSFRKSVLTQFAPKLAGIDNAALQAWAADTTPNATTPPNLGMLSRQVTVKNPTGTDYKLEHGSVVICAITSCTNTSNPGVLMAAGLLAQKAVAKGLTVKPWVKTSLAPGSKVVTDYLKESGLLDSLEKLKFHVVGYGCTTCIGNSGPLPDPVSHAVTEGDLAVASVLSGNRNFEGRVNTQVRANYLASPPLVVAWALAGNINMNLMTDALGTGSDGKPVYLKDIWPSTEEVTSAIQKFVTPKQFKKSYEDVFSGDSYWKGLQVPTGDLYKWDSKSTYIKEPSFFADIQLAPKPLKDITKAHCLALLGDSITTDHISPAGNIGKTSPAGQYLQSLGVAPADFNQYGARRGNHEVMVRGTFANVRLKNLMVPGIEGGVTIHTPTLKQMSIFDASMQYQADGVSLIVIAGKEYGTGSSRDWAAKGPKLLGIHAVIAESFERIHRSNLVGMGILPLQFKAGESATTHDLTGFETFTIENVAQIGIAQEVTVKFVTAKGVEKTMTVKSRLDTPNEVEYYRHGGILPYVLRQMATAK